MNRTVRRGKSAFAPEDLMPPDPEGEMVEDNSYGFAVVGDGDFVGFFINDDSGRVFIGNEAIQNGLAGFNIIFITGEKWRHNVALEPGRHGFRLRAVEDSWFNKNRADWNGTDSPHEGPMMS